MDLKFVNISQTDLKIPGLLSPEDLCIRYEIVDPEGRKRPYEAFAVDEIEYFPIVTLKPGESFSHRQILVYSPTGYVFPNAGKYKVQVIYPDYFRKMEDTKSNILTMEVIEPVTEEDRQALALFRGDKQGKFMVGYGGEIPEAIEKLETLVRLYPKSTYAPHAKYYLAYRFMRPDLSRSRTLYLKAIQEFSALLQEYPRFALADQVKFQIGVCYRSIGENSQAIIQLKRLICEHPQSPLVMKAKELLKQIQKGQR